MPFKFAGEDDNQEKWNSEANQTVKLTKANIMNIIREMKTTVKDYAGSHAEGIYERFVADDGENVVIEKGMHPDGNGYMHIRVGMLGDSYHLYARFNEKTAHLSRGGWSVLIAVTYTQSQMDRTLDLGSLDVARR